VAGNALKETEQELGRNVSSKKNYPSEKGELKMEND